MRGFLLTHLVQVKNPAVVKTTLALCSTVSVKNPAVAKTTPFTLPFCRSLCRFSFAVSFVVRCVVRFLCHFRVARSPPSDCYVVLNATYNTHANSTAARFISSFTSIYACVTAMLRCPAKLASTRTPMPLFANVVINVLLPL